MNHGAEPACPVCQSADTVALGAPMHRRPTTVAGVPIRLDDLNLMWRRCRSCGYQFIHPGIPEERLLACYSRATTGHWPTADASYEHVRFYAQKKALLERFAPGKRVLDFGCFDGGFLAYLGDGYEKLGVEPATDAARAAERRGVKIVGATIAEAAAGGIAPVDAVVSFDVFEHLSDPVGALRDCRRLLRDGGIVLLETGNSDEPLWRKVGVRYSYQVYVEHVGVFNESSISEAGRRAGFTLAHFQTSAHHALGWKLRAAYGMVNSAHDVLRGLDRARLPMPARWREIARGPLPPRTTRNDHFLAILKTD